MGATTETGHHLRLRSDRLETPHRPECLASGSTSGYRDGMPGLHRKRKRPTGDGEYAAMLGRMITAYGKRVGADPAAALPHLRELEQALTDNVNFGIWQANKVGGHSVNQLADVLGVSKQAIFKRVTLGEQVARQRERTQRRSISQARKAAPKQLPSGSTGD